MCWWHAIADHLPLYRQAQILARQGGVIIERSTLSFWMGYAALAEVAPVVGAGCGR